MAMITETGTIRERGELKTGTSQSGREWAFQDIVLEVMTGNNRYKNLVVKADINTISDLDQLPDGASVEVTYYVDAREYNGRWYPEAHLFSVKPAGQSQHVGGTNFSRRTYGESEQAPAAPAPQQQVNVETDLPF